MLEDLKATSMEMEWNALKAMINLVDVSKLVARASCYRRMCAIIQLQWHIQEDTEE